MKLIFTTLIFFGAISVFAEKPDNFKFLKNDLDRTYMISYAQNQPGEVIVSLRNHRGKVMFTERFKGLSMEKHYDLSKFKKGTYEFSLTCGEKKYREIVILRSEEEIMAERVKIEKHSSLLTVQSTEEENNPLNIFIYAPDGELLKMYYWKPTDHQPVKKIDISGFESEDLKIQITQNGEEIANRRITTHY